MFLKIDEKEIDDKRRKLKQFSVGGLKSEQFQKENRGKD